MVNWKKYLLLDITDIHRPSRVHLCCIRFEWPHTQWCSVLEETSSGLINGICVYSKRNTASEFHTQIMYSQNLHHRQTGRYYQLLFGLLLNIFLVVQSMVIMPLFACVYIILEFSGLKPCSLAWMLPTNPLHTCESKLAIFQRHCYNVFKTFLINPKHKQKTLW